MEKEVWTNFADIIWPKAGDRVTYTTTTYLRGWRERITGEGIVDYLGAGIEPFFKVRNGPFVHPTLGDTWRLV